MANIWRDDEHTRSLSETQDAASATRGDYWLQRANEAYEASSDIWQTNYYKQWERNLRHFQNRHHSGSRYYSPEYSRRSRMFRPKSRSAVRRNEAAANMAFFSTEDVVVVTPEDERSPSNILAAELRKELLNYRLTTADRRRGIPWFSTLIGAYQETQVISLVCSHQYWLYEEDAEEEEYEVEDTIDGTTGRPFIERRMHRNIRYDRPEIELVPMENMRFHPAAKWNDPVNSSPYLIHMIPMYLYEVRERMERDDDSAWYYYDDIQIASSRSDLSESIAQTREGNDRQDPRRDQPHRVGDFTVVWVHRNIIRDKGKDVLFYTLGTHHRLSDPKPLTSEYAHGMRPYVIGSCVIETHRNVPASPLELVSGLQSLTNEVANQRIDNVRLVLNKRYFVDRNGNVDVQALKKNSPGSTVAMDDVNNNVKIVDTPDVTASSYQEQNHINVDIDDLMGTFSSGSVQSNRTLNETVGGLSLLNQDANQLTEHQLRVFAETWVEPVLQQIDALEMHYESDETVLNIAGNRSKMWRQVRQAYMQRVGHEPRINEQLFNSPNIEVKVNVGFGATNPTGRVEKMVLGLNTVATVMPNAMMRIKEDDVIDEIFGALGYQSGARFFQQEEGEQQDPRLMQMQRALQELQMQVETEAHKVQAKAQADMAIAQAKAQTEGERQQSEQQHAMQLEQLRLAMKRYEIDQRQNDARTGRRLETDRFRFDVDKEDYRRKYETEKDGYEREERKIDRDMQVEDKRYERAAAEDDRNYQRETAKDETTYTRAYQEAKDGFGEAPRTTLEKVDEVQAFTQDVNNQIASLMQLLASIKAASDGTLVNTSQLEQQLRALSNEVNDVSDTVTEVEKDSERRAQAAKIIRDYLAANGSESTKALIDRLSRVETE